MMSDIVHYFDRLEDRVRGRLAQYPILYTLVGGIAIVLFWRGVWITADQLSLYLPENLYWINGLLSVAVSVLVLLVTGLFVAFFISDKIIISGMKREKKLVEKTETEVRQERDILLLMLGKMDKMEKDVAALKRKPRAKKTPEQL